MKKILSIITVFVIGLSFMGSVNADEQGLSSVATISKTIGGSDKEIVQVDTANKYKFYYKYVALDQTQFSDYVKARYTVDNADSSTDQYSKAASSVGDYESQFQSKIGTVKAADLEKWTLSSDNEITLSGLTYQSGKHNGYVLAVAAVKDGDTSKVYIDRMILESTSSTTLGEIAFLDSDKTVTTSQTTDEDETTVQSESNPNTGISDYAMYLVPLCIIVGSAILLKRKYS